MPEWLSRLQDAEGAVTPEALAARLILAVVFGVAVAAVYRVSHGREKRDGLPTMTTLVLLSILIAMVSMVIGNSVARAFSLVGALSIVRFRTVVDDTRDTAYVIFSVIVGMAAGAGLVWVPVVGIPIVAVASICMSRLGAPVDARASECTLCVRLALGRDPESLLGPVLSRHLTEQHVTSAGTARQGAAIDVTYRVQLQPQASMADLVTELNQVDGVMSAELNRLP
jgi:uncharacterized membrane protein YhiD involved in acid resistance